MADKVKSSMLLLIALILISLSLASGAYYFLQKERAKNLTLQDQMEELNTRQKVNETRLDESKKLIGALENKLKDAQSQIDTLSGELQQEKSAKQEALTQIEQLRADLDQQKRLRSDLEKKFNQAQEDARKIQNQVRELDAKKTELEMKVSDLEAKAQSGVELGKIVVSPEALQVQQKGKPAKEKKAAAPKETKVIAQAKDSKPVLAASQDQGGKVLVINKDYNFAVINLGSKDGVNIGDTFSIYHGNKYLGDVKVEKVHDSMAAAGFSSQEMKDKVSEGDKVVPKTK